MGAMKWMGGGDFRGPLLGWDVYVFSNYDYRSSPGGMVVVSFRLRQDIRRPSGRVRRKSFSQFRIPDCEIFFGILLIKCRHERLYT